MDAKLAAIKQSIKTTTSDLQAVPPAQATQTAVTVHKELKEVRRLISELQLTAEWQIANDSSATSQSTGMTVTGLNSIQEPLAGMPLNEFNSLKQQQANRGKQLTREVCRKANTKAPKKTPRRSKDKERIVQLEFENLRLGSEVTNLESKVATLEGKLTIARAENRRLSEKLRQSASAPVI